MCTSNFGLSKNMLSFVFRNSESQKYCQEQSNMTKYIFVTGGVTSSLGKGIISASLAKLLQARGLKVTIQKFDPYLNVDPGTLNPYEHGECYVTDDGAETDLDLGHYERFLNTPTSQANNVTTGRVYQTVINKEREGPTWARPFRSFRMLPMKLNDGCSCWETITIMILSSPN